MKLEEQELLLRDLCGRLPYWVKCVAISDGYIGCISSIESQYGVVTFDDGRQEEICDIKPYLFPLSSMTEEQLNDFYAIIRPVVEDDLNEYSDYEENEKTRPVTMKSIKVDVVSVNWMLKNHFDMNGLIPMGLAIDATGLDIYKEETK